MWAYAYTLQCCNSSHQYFNIWKVNLDQNTFLTIWFGGDTSLICKLNHGFIMTFITHINISSSSQHVIKGKKTCRIQFCFLNWFIFFFILTISARFIGHITIFSMLNTTIIAKHNNWPHMIFAFQYEPFEHKLNNSNWVWNEKKVY